MRGWLLGLVRTLVEAEVRGSWVIEKQRGQEIAYPGRSSDPYVVI